MSLVRRIKSITNTVGEGVTSAAAVVSSATTKQKTTYPISNEKKGEINELRAALSDPSIDRDDNKKREVLQRVIGYMTMGLDTSKLFHSMIMCVHTKDIVQKKMVYQYITHYAHQNQDVAILTINTLSRDSCDENPLVRGLALRSLSSLRIPKLVEHLLPLIRERLNDSSPYVRKTAVLSIVKLYRMDPKSVEDEKYVERLYAMIRDKDVQVIVNCIKALNEILKDEEGIKVTKKMTYYLLNRVSEYTEWQLCEVLELLLKYQPQSNNEVFDLMNLLDDRLQMSNSAVIMGIANLFLHYTKNMPKVYNKVFIRLRDPLLLLLSSSTHELSYTILHHIKLMASRAPKVFTPHFRDFFIKHLEPGYLKHLKLETLAVVANEHNVREIMEELSYYVSMGDTELSTSRKAVSAFGEIAVSISSAAEMSLTYLLDFLDLGLAHVLSETFIVLKDILRKYNNEDFCRSYLPAITKHWRLIDDSKSISSFLWILGEYGDIIELAPYILETFIDDFKNYHSSVRLEILSSSVKLFFKRPPEMQDMLGRLLAVAVDDSSHADVHDRALFYYRLLDANVYLAREVIMTKKQIVSNFTEEDSVEFKEKLFSEFNTLSVVFGKPSERFIVKSDGVLGEEDEEEDEEEEEDLPEQGHYDNGDEYYEEENEEESDEKEENLLASYDRESGQLLEFAMDASRPALSLSPNPQPLDPSGYQSKWTTTTASKQISSQIRSHCDAETVEEVMKDHGIECLATNTKADPYVFFFFAQHTDGSYFLVQAKVHSKGAVEATIKHDKNSTSEVDIFTKSFFKKALAQLL